MQLHEKVYICGPETWELTALPCVASVTIGSMLLLSRNMWLRSDLSGERDIESQVGAAKWLPANSRLIFEELLVPASDH